MTTITQEKEYYLSTKDERGGDLIYSSDIWKMSEIDILNLIKVCLIEARNKTVGKKILAVYRDSTEHRKELTEENLKKIGIEDNEKFNPERSTKQKYK